MNHAYFENSHPLFTTLCGKDHSKKHQGRPVSCNKCHRVLALRRNAVYVVFGEGARAILRMNKKGLTEQCPFCGKGHHHSLGDGHRMAHCGHEVSFKRKDGIVLDNWSGYFVVNFDFFRFFLPGRFKRNIHIDENFLDRGGGLPPEERRSASENNEKHRICLGRGDCPAK